MIAAAPRTRPTYRNMSEAERAAYIEGQMAAVSFGKRAGRGKTYLELPPAERVAFIDGQLRSRGLLVGRA